MVNGSKIKELRKSQNLTTKELANELAVSQSLVSYIELGYKKPSVELLIKIANYFDLKVDDLLIK